MQKKVNKVLYKIRESNFEEQRSVRRCSFKKKRVLNVKKGAKNHLPFELSDLMNSDLPHIDVLP